MPLEIIVVDDNNQLRGTIESAIPLLSDYTARGFPTARACIDYLETLLTENYPVGYIVDMRLVGDEEGSEALFNFLKAKGKTDNFYFFTAHLSIHDKEVIERTHANVLLKASFTFEELLAHMKSRQVYLPSLNYSQ